MTIRYLMTLWILLLGMSSCTDDLNPPVIDYFMINDTPVNEDFAVQVNDILHLKISITDDGGLKTHELRYDINQEKGENLIRIEDEIVNTIVEEFYIDLSMLDMNQNSYAAVSGDMIEFKLQASDLNGNEIFRSYIVRVQ